MHGVVNEDDKATTSSGWAVATNCSIVFEREEVGGASEFGFLDAGNKDLMSFQEFGKLIVGIKNAVCIEL